jgi:hypothetical protein
MCLRYGGQSPSVGVSQRAMVSPLPGLHVVGAPIFCGGRGAAQMKRAPTAAQLPRLKLMRVWAPSGGAQAEFDRFSAADKQPCRVAAEGAPKSACR